MPISKRRVLSASLLGLLLGFVFLPLSAAAQSTAPNEWTWMGGTILTCDTCFAPGVYGTLRTPAAGNIPGGREVAATWTDKNGNFWLFGGVGYDATAGPGVLFNDLWMFNPSTRLWAWMGGNNTFNNNRTFSYPGVYGTLGTSSLENIPGSRSGSVTWTDNNGNLWLFGGDGFDANNTGGILNDFWKFNPLTNEWTWMGGSNITLCTVHGCGQPGVYGSLGVPSTGNIPGGRYNPATWTDSNGNLWLFGGEGFDANQSRGTLNDLWEYVVSSNEWIWVDGSNIIVNFWYTQPGVYGTLGTPSTINIPGGRVDALAWKDKSGYFWMFGGDGADVAGNMGELNDLWKYNVSTNEWTWMGGSNTVNQAGIYGTLDSFASENIPTGRDSAATWTDSNGNFWLFAGTFYDSNYGLGHLNDLWVFNPSTNEWAWMGGDNEPICTSLGCGSPGIYGVLGTSSSSNIPGSRALAASWTDNTGNLWLFGGIGYMMKDYSSSIMNDFWVYQPDLNLVANYPHLTITGSSVTVTAGASFGNTSTITLTPAGGFTGSVALTAAITSGSSGGIQPTLSFGSTTPVSITGAAAGTATLAITTTASSTTPCTAENRMQQGIPWYSGGGAVLACLLLFGIPARRRSWLKMLSMSFLLIALAGGAIACGGGGGGKTCTPTTIAGTTPGSYTITVTGASGSTTSTGTVNLTVQ